MTIRLKLVLLLVMFAMLSAAMSGWHIYGHLSEVEEGAVRDAESSAQAFAVSLTFVDETTDIPPIYKSPSGLRDFIYDRKRLLADVEDFVVVDGKKKILGDVISENVGRIFDHDKNDEVGQTIRDGIARTFIERSTDYPEGIRQLVVPLKTEEGETVGAVIMEYTAYYNKYIVLIKKEIRIILIFSALILFISLGIGYYLAGGIAGNIARLKKATEAMAAGDLEAKAEVGSRDELGDLAAAFNSMAEMRKNAEEKLREKEEEFRTLIENSQDVIQRFDRQLNRLYVNPVIEKYTGIPYKEFLGKTDRELGLPEQNIVLWEKAAQTLFETGKDQTVEFDFPTPQGHTYFETHLMPEFGTDGKAVSILVITRDITERKRADEMLRDSEAQFRKLFENSNDAIFIHTVDGRILDANSQAENMMGYPLAVLKSMPVPALHPPEELETSKKAFEETISKGSARFESRFLHSGGAIINVEISSRIVDSAKGIIQGIVRDITERKKAEDELKRLYEELQEKTEYLERFNRLVVGREVEMLKLKAEVNELLEKTGQPKKYEAPTEAEEL